MTKKQAKRLRQWREQLAGIENQLLSAHLDRNIWQRTRDGVVKQHPEADAHFIASYSRAYVVSQATRIRILSSERGDKRSVPDLIASIRKNPDVLDKANWVEMVTNDSTVVGSDPGTFYETHLGDAEGNLSRKDLRADRKTIRKAAGRLPAWTGQVVEHLDRGSLYSFRASDVRLAYDEIDEALESLGNVTRRLQLLLKGRKSSSWNAKIQADWREPLRASLFPFQDVSFLLPSSGDFS
jgi:hypothetical protein